MHSLPEQNARMKKLVKTFMLSNHDLAGLWNCFQHLDVQKLGKIRPKLLWQGHEIDEDCILSEALYDLCEVDMIGLDPEINFSEFCALICTLCCFEPPEMLRFCMFVYDPEKNGFITIDDFKSLMNGLHHVVPPDTVKGNIKASWMRSEFPASGQLTIEDIVELHRSTPLILEPAFQFQRNVMQKYMGISYWEAKKRFLFEARIKADILLAKKKAKKEKKARAGKERKIKKSMGILRYYLCPCLRFMYDPDSGYGLTDEQKAAAARNKRLEELAIKNPQTAHWKKFSKKIDPRVGGSEDYVVVKVLKTERHREVRQSARADRRAERKNDDILAHQSTENDF